MARKISFIANVLKPIHINSRRYSVFNETEDFIPATTMRGVLANSICKKNQKWECDGCNCKSTCNFEKIFINNHVRFDNLYPVADYFDQSSCVTPATAVSCKRRPGFLSQYNYEISKGKRKAYKEPPHGVFDLLIPQLAHQIAGDYDYEFHCSECPSKLEPFFCFYNVDHNEKVLFEAEAGKRRLVRTAINREKRTAEEKLLFSLEIIEEGTTFVGTVTFSDNNLGPVILEELKKLESSRFGAVRSRGFGEIKIYPEDSSDFDNDIKNRILTFNHFLGCYIKNLNNSNTEEQGEYFTINLHSDAILKNDKGEYSALIDEKILSTYLKSFEPGLDLKSLSLVKWSTSQSLSFGWSDTWKLPKDIKPAVKRGSVFVFKIDSLTEELVKALNETQTWGIGEKCEEGYGKVIICDPFHWGFQEKDHRYDDKWRY